VTRPTTTVPAPPRALGAVRPGLAALPAAFVLALTASLVLWSGDGAIGITGWATTVLWTLPTVGSVLGIGGALRTRRRLRAARHQDPSITPVPERLVVVVPTIGRSRTTASTSWSRRVAWPAPRSGSSPPRHRRPAC
jgi:hypothetical protein